MIIKTIDINNFRGFADYHVEFAPSVTILIGRNGAGKSSLIDALHKSLSFIFSNNRSLGNDFLSSGNPSLKVNSFSPEDYHVDQKKKEVSHAISLHTTAVYHGEPIEWTLYKRTTSGASLYTSKYQDAFNQFMRLWRGGANLPLLVFYSDSFPHRNVKETQYALGTIANSTIPKNFGYYQWDVEGACTSIWEIRLCNILAQMTPLYTPAMRVASRILELKESLSPQDLESNEEYKAAILENERLTEIMTPLSNEETFVHERLSTFMESLPYLNDQGYIIDYFVPIQSDESYRLCFTFKNGKTLALQELPAGYRRLYSIVLDMAYRSFILNGDQEPSGIVMIDEIDLHLHPSLEQEIVNALHNTFPRVQFIISTHSAAVISNLNTKSEHNKVLFMSEDQDHPESLPNIYGLDYNAALRDFMDTPSRSMEVRKMIDEFLAFSARGYKNESKSLYKRIVELLGIDNPLVKELKEKSMMDEVH